GCLSAALAGFAVTVVARSQMREGLRELGPEQGLPTLPEARFYAFSRQPSLAADALIEAVRQLGQRSRFVTAQG
ncbi:LysR family transcriptional regulator, partial [Pseudomonas aeruginosa]|nr:LysR family transcriptional regulator [Pseudomonas aeruginosa]